MDAIVEPEESQVDGLIEGQAARSRRLGAQAQVQS